MPQPTRVGRSFIDYKGDKLTISTIKVSNPETNGGREFETMAFFEKGDWACWDESGSQYCEGHESWEEAEERHGKIVEQLLSGKMELFVHSRERFSDTDPDDS